MREKISVALASYNGEKYIAEQIDSILMNLSENDELIISDDNSTDGTRAIIESYKDSRIHLIDGPALGVKKNFENAIKACAGRYIFLSDQDDIWEKDKVSTVLSAFENSNCPVVVHDCTIVDEVGNVLVPSFYEYRKSGPGIIKNFWKNTYIGCCMAFDSALLKKEILPIPNDIEMHDQWIGMIGDRFGKNVFISEKLIKYRRHSDTETDCFHRHSADIIIKNRVHLFFRMLMHK